MCRPPAKRSVAETSALRQQGLVTEMVVSSAFTREVIAIRHHDTPTTRGIGFAGELRLEAVITFATSHATPHDVQPTQHQVAYTAASLSTSWRGSRRRVGHVGGHELRTEYRGGRARVLRRLGRRRTRSRPRPRRGGAIRVLGSAWRCGPGESLRSHRACGATFSVRMRRALCLAQCRGQLGDHQVRHHPGEPRAGAEDHDVGVEDRLRRTRDMPADPRRIERDRRDPARRSPPPRPDRAS